MRTRASVALGIAYAVLVLGVVTVAGSHLIPRASAVPTDWSPPTALPRGTALPANLLTFNSDRTGNFELFTMDIDGAGVRQLTDDDAYDSWSPRVSPDRRTVLFLRSPDGVHDTDYSRVGIWAVASSGGTPVQLRPPGLDGWHQQGHPEWSPDGSTLVMFGGTGLGTQIYRTTALGQSPKPVTVDRPGSNLDPFFTADGTAVLFVGCPAAFCPFSKYEIYSTPLDGGVETRLTNDTLRDHDPVASPDGESTAWLTNISGGTTGVWDIKIQTGSAPPRRLVGDRGITSRPEYSRDGAYIFMHRLARGANHFDVYRVQPDGSGLVNLTKNQPGSNEYPGP